jgi:hypothetical protein
MWVVAIFALLILLAWVLGLSSFVPAPVLVIVFAAMGSGAAATLWFSSRRRRAHDPDAVIQPDTKI